MKKTYMQKEGEIKRDWHLIDLKGQTVGRVAGQIARLLMGKHKSSYTPHMDNGDFVVTINTEQLRFTGNKLHDKVYARHSGQPDGFKSVTAQQVMDKDPRKVIEHAVKGMLPKNKLQTPRLRRLKAYTGTDHPHANHFTSKEI